MIEVKLRRQNEYLSVFVQFANKDQFQGLKLYFVFNSKKDQNDDKKENTLE